MPNTAKVIPLRKKVQPKTSKKREKKIKCTDTVKYLNKKQILALRRAVKDQALISKERGNITAQREWMVIDLFTSTGLRVSEAADLRCGDLKLGYGECAIFVRCGKGRKSRTVQIPESLKTHLKSFLKLKINRGEPVDEDDHLFLGQRGPWSIFAIGQIVKKYLKLIGLESKYRSCHTLRHSYAVHYYRKNKDLRALQKQLGHASIRSTEIYADVLDDDIKDQLKNFWS